jgi:hypothetical protein
VEVGYSMLFLQKYKKINTILIIYSLTFFVFSFFTLQIENLLTQLGVVGVALSGFLYTYSFTGSIGTGTFLLLSGKYSSVYLAFLGGIFAALADMSILKIFKTLKLKEEVNAFCAEPIFVSLVNKFTLLKNKFFVAFAGLFFLASPLPDEFGMIFLSKSKVISMKYIFIISFIANFVGIYLLTKI